MSMLSLPTELITQVLEEFFDVRRKIVLKARPVPNYNISWRGAPSIAPLLTCRLFHRLGVKLYRAKFIEFDISELGEEESGRWLPQHMIGPREWICSAIERLTWSVYPASFRVQIDWFGFENLRQMRLVVPSSQLYDMSPFVDGPKTIEYILQDSLVKDDKFPEHEAIIWLNKFWTEDRQDCQWRVTWEASVIDQEHRIFDEQVLRIEYDVMDAGNKLQLSLQCGSIEPLRHSETELYRERFYDIVHAIKQLRGQTERRDLPWPRGLEISDKWGWYPWRYRI